ncbi:hypothetical protein PAHAL_4G169400 [Panicum hallii]|jgi:hypothetical protein|uniref:Uncharacterized protein n=1 Tax=Panicum hallii TaxID=206008 RepID=A0A2T8JD77_9POAL|nr:hypothetical protein PAHAL_4G169400 [Panicum hallii]
MTPPPSLVPSAVTGIRLNLLRGRLFIEILVQPIIQKERKEISIPSFLTRLTT